MILDAALVLSDSQAITASATSTNILDLGAIRNVGVGENLYLVVCVTVAFTDSSSDSTIQVDIETDDNSSFSSAVARQRVGIFAALSAIGTRLVARLAPDVLNERYLRVYYTAANGSLTTGSFDAFIVKDIDAVSYYANGYTVH